MKIKYVSSLVFAAAAFVAAVRAQHVVSYYAEVPNVTADSPQILELPGFDTALGSLTEVKLTYSGEVWQSVFGENTGDSSAAYDLSSATQLGLAKADGLTLFSSPSFSLTKKGTAGAYDGKVDFADASGVRFNQNAITNGIYVDSQLAQYAGVGAVDFKAFATNSSQLQADGSFAKGATVSTLASLSVDYTFMPFTEIPEPSTYAVLMGGAVILGAALKRQRLILA
jgi:hypothetical protein